MAQRSLSDLDPLADLHRFFATSAEAVDTWQEGLAQAKAALWRLESAAQAQGGSLELEALSGDLTRAVLPHLLGTVRGTVRSYVMELDGGPAGTPGATRAARERVRSGRSVWTLYPSTILGTAEGVAMARQRADWGEAQRVCALTQTQFVVIGDDVVLTLATWGDPTGGYVLVRHPLVVTAFRAYFDASWSTARSVNQTPTMPLDDERLIELLGYGLKDEAIARIMGIGLRTVRRRIAAVMAAHGVETRFQLGAALERAARE